MSSLELIFSFSRFYTLLIFIAWALQLPHPLNKLLMSNLYPLNLEVLLKPTKTKNRELAF